MAMRKKLTAKTVEALAPQGPKRLEVYDVTLPGFGLRISPSGHKSWFCAVRDNSRQRRVTLGPYPRVSLADAREAARKVMSDAETGVLAPPCPTLSETIPQFIELYARPKNRNWRESERILHQKFKPLFDKPLTDIKRPDIVRILDDMVARGIPGRANHAMAAIKKLMNWALNRGMIEVNPIAGLSAPGKKTERVRVLHDGEIKLLFEATQKEGYPFGTVYQLLLYTGQRRSEVSGMRWCELDWERRVWTIPAARSKNASAHEVPLADTVVDILKRIPRFLGSAFVFTTTGITPISGFGRAKDRVELAVGSNDWWAHDLRRTAASGMARLGISPHVIEKVLNHKTGQISGVAAVYNRYGYENEKRDALEKWADYVRRCVTKSVETGDCRRARTTTGLLLPEGTTPLARSVH